MKNLVVVQTPWVGVTPQSMKKNIVVEHLLVG